jgi:DNA-binding beta-propeller fold protein YncE
MRGASRYLCVVLALLATIMAAACGGGSGGGSASVVPRFAYVANYDDNSTGVLVNVNCAQFATNVLVSCNQWDFRVGARPVAVAIHPSGKFAFVTSYGGPGGSASISAFTISASSGALSKIDCVPSAAVVCNGTDFLAGGSPRAIATPAAFSNS